MKTLVLPGMDGGAALLAEFCARLGQVGQANNGAEALPYPRDEVLDYAALEACVRARLAETAAPTTLIAESFSGPIAIAIAASPPPNLKRVALVATFDHAPAPTFLAPLVRAAMFRRPPPAFFIRWKMLGNHASKEDVAAVQDAIRDVDATVLAERLRSLLKVDVQDKAKAIQLPVLSLRGSQDRLVSRPLSLANSSWHEEVIDGPHLLLQQCPGECADAIRRFVV